MTKCYFRLENEQLNSLQYLAYFGHFFNQSNLNLLKQQELLDLNELQMNKQTAHVTLPTIPVCTSAVADTARLAASPCRSKCCTAEVQHGATTPQIRRGTGTQATTTHSGRRGKGNQRHWLKKYYRIVQIQTCTDNKMISNDCVNQLCHSEAPVEGLR